MYQALYVHYCHMNLTAGPQHLQHLQPQLPPQLLSEHCQ
jgi:hypothetical protein